MKKNKKYYVWIGGTPNIFHNILDAKIELKEWNEKGYNDVYLSLIHI